MIIFRNTIVSQKRTEEPTIPHWDGQNLRGRFQTLFACGSMVLPISSVVRFFALRAKNEQQKEDKIPLRVTTFGHRVNPVT